MLSSLLLARTESITKNRLCITEARFIKLIYQGKSNVCGKTRDASIERHLVRLSFEEGMQPVLGLDRSVAAAKLVADDQPYRKCVMGFC